MTHDAQGTEPFEQRIAARYVDARLSFCQAVRTWSDRDVDQFVTSVCDLAALKIEKSFAEEWAAAEAKMAASVSTEALIRADERGRIASALREYVTANSLLPTSNLNELTDFILELK